MYSAILMIVGALFFASVPPPAVAAETAVELPEAGVQSQGSKTPGDGGGVLPETPSGEEGTATAPEAVYRSGCIARPGGQAVINLRARNVVQYRVVPTRFFDVTMQVTYVGLRSFFVDRRFAGGTESVSIRGPGSFWPVKVTIRGYRGSTGCFAFSATP